MKIEKNVVVWFVNVFSNCLEDGGIWLYPDGDSIWQKRGNTVTMIRGNPMNKNNQKTALHICAAGFTVAGIE